MSAGLDQVTDLPSLVEYLRDELEWPIAEADFEALTFDYKPEEVGLDSAKVGGGIEIKQLRPLSRKQPWGIFFVNLPQKRLSTTILRTLLGSLAPKKRASSNPAERAVFDQRDLMFIANTGEAGHRHIDFAHFRNPEEGQRTAPLQVLGWDADDTERRMKLTGAMLKDKLHWPEPTEDVDTWRERWTDAFREPPRYPIRQSKLLAAEMAKLAKRIRNRVAELIAVETDKGALRRLHQGFKEALIHDLTPEKFADYYAQTITYGLFSARVSRPSTGFGHDTIHLNVAGTSPFLKEMLAQFLEAGGRKASSGSDHLDFDALGVGDVIAMLEATDMDSVLADWDHRNQDEDPVVHFYQDFLDLYDPGEKKKRGVFYTPRPVVSFMVRSVDEALRTDFDLPDGLASTATWAEIIATNPEIKLPKGATESDPFVSILDPATGTGTFLVECVDLIHKTMLAKWKAAGKRNGEVAALWNDYVPKHLLPRLTGFELMMAPYAIAHVKLGLKLADTGYTFGSDARAQIYLTNALEPAQDLNMQLAFMSKALAHEAKAANGAKDSQFTVVVGNPPYSLMSGNLGPAQRLIIEPYRFVNGAKIKERGALQLEKNLQDDYVKFFRISEEYCQRSPLSVLSLITNHSYLQSPSLRGLRHSLFETFSTCEFIDAHGNSKTGEKSPTGDADENIFEIQQGVAICCLIRRPSAQHTVLRGDIWGTREAKYHQVSNPVVPDIAKELIRPAGPIFAIEPSDDELRSEFRSHPSIAEIFPLYSTGVATARDGMAVRFTQAEAKVLQTDFLTLSGDALREKYDLGKDTNDWKVSLATADVKAQPKNSDLTTPYQYRPFDSRWTLYTGKPRGFLCNPRQPVMRNLGERDVGLCTVKAIEGGGGYRHVIVTNKTTDHHCISLKEVSYVTSLWLMPQGTERRVLPNIASTVASRVASLIGRTWDDCVDGPKQGVLATIVKPKAQQTAMFVHRRERGEPGKSFGPRDLFDYIYAVLHSPSYRDRYADYLKSDFARVPLPASAQLFEELVPIGTELVSLHLLDADAAPILKDPKSVRLAGGGEARVTMPAAKFESEAFENGRMYIAADKSRWFETIPPQAADFQVGGYIPARKWLKDRAARGGKKASVGRPLSDDDILHYRRMIVALTRTFELTKKIDDVIEKTGGWPGAFRGMADDAEIKAAE